MIPSGRISRTSSSSSSSNQSLAADAYRRSDLVIDFHQNQTVTHDKIPLNNDELTNKSYVDGQIATKYSAGDSLHIADPNVLSTNTVPIDDFDVANKLYVDDSIAGIVIPINSQTQSVIIRHVRERTPTRNGIADAPTARYTRASAHTRMRTNYLFPYMDGVSYTRNNATVYPYMPKIRYPTNEIDVESHTIPLHFNVSNRTTTNNSGDSYTDAIYVLDVADFIDGKYHQMLTDVVGFDQFPLKSGYIRANNYYIVDCIIDDDVDVEFDSAVFINCTILSTPSKFTNSTFLKCVIGDRNKPAISFSICYFDKCRIGKSSGFITCSSSNDNEFEFVRLETVGSWIRPYRNWLTSKNSINSPNVIMNESSYKREPMMSYYGRIYIAPNGEFFHYYNRPVTTDTTNGIFIRSQSDFDTINFINDNPVTGKFIVECDLSIRTNVDMKNVEFNCVNDTKIQIFDCTIGCDEAVKFIGCRFEIFNPNKSVFVASSVDAEIECDFCVFVYATHQIFHNFTSISLLDSGFFNCFVYRDSVTAKCLVQSTFVENAILTMRRVSFIGCKYENIVEPHPTVINAFVSCGWMDDVNAIYDNVYFVKCEFLDSTFFMNSFVCAPVQSSESMHFYIMDCKFNCDMLNNWVVSSTIGDNANIHIFNLTNPNGCVINAVGTPSKSTYGSIAALSTANLTRFYYDFDHNEYVTNQSIADVTYNSFRSINPRNMYGNSSNRSKTTGDNYYSRYARSANNVTIQPEIGYQSHSIIGKFGLIKFNVDVTVLRNEFGELHACSRVADAGYKYDSIIDVDDNVTVFDVKSMKFVSKPYSALVSRLSPNQYLFDNLDSEFVSKVGIHPISGNSTNEIYPYGKICHMIKPIELKSDDVIGYIDNQIVTFNGDLFEY